ncbi:MAG TPA: EAL domain-containing protein, partial [Acidimicrobiales bacterium]|nr:EAL domain-containing protein [Acidimicrobiales bacterium]
LTESALVESEVTLPVLHALRDLGVRLHLDDFGTGYSSLAHLQDLPLHTVKIDRHFISRLGTEPAADAVTGAVVAVADRLGLSVIAEGVETDEQLDRVTALGVHLIQGYRFAPPAPLDELRHEWGTPAVVERRATPPISR